ncbi:hypothetical protein ACHQM5_015823 [Ranunculus cassubicifolius]
MEVEIINGEEQPSSENEAKSQGLEEDNVLLFLDSLDSYLTRMDSLSSTLRQGWIDLASARYSMGTSRVTSALFDLKVHPAATTLQVSQLDSEPPQQDPMVKEPHFALSRRSTSPGESKDITPHENDTPKKNFNSLLRHRVTSEYSVEKELTTIASPVSPRSPLTSDDQVQKERSKSLSVFGTLVSPKLREAQVSFETALETLLEIANMRSMMLSAYAKLQQDKGGSSQ